MRKRESAPTRQVTPANRKPAMGWKPSESVPPWTRGAQIALTLPFLLGMAIALLTEVCRAQ